METDNDETTPQQRFKRRHSTPSPNATPQIISQQPPGSTSPNDTKPKKQKCNTR